MVNLGASLVAQLVKNPDACNAGDLVRFLGWEDLLEKESATHSSILGFPWCSDGKESACNVWDLGSIPGLGRSPGEGKDYPLLENSMYCILHGLAKSRTWLHFHFHFHFRNRKVRLIKAIIFPVIMYRCESWTIRKLSTKELMLLNLGIGEDSWESLGLRGDQTSQS